MPLGGLFGGGGTSKARPLTQTDSGGVTTKEKPKKDFGDKDARGAVLKLQNHTVIVDKKLAEGGFAIVYLVTDRQNRHYALKRQFVSDDPRQVEACKRECQIINSLKGHKNIVHYVDHILTRNKSGVFDYMLLTVYYKNSILGVMNERLASGKSLSPAEVLAIFCDMCEAVARLHHSHTPVIHRDLKVENILVDERNRGAPPIYVLCDFGSATTKVFSSEIHPVSVVQEEIEKYTTLSYRAPEMIDVYSGKPIGTKADIWAMGVMLFKLIYFSLPFGDSAMAIQNGAFSFPSQPTVPESLRAIIKALLVSDLDLRPNIYQTSQLAFEAANLPNPVQNIERASVPSLSALVSAMEIGSTTPLAARQKEQPKEPVIVPQEGDLLSRVTSHPTQSLTTSVNPRLRPKPSNGALKLEQSFPAALVQNASVSEPDFETGFDSSQTVANVPDQAPLSCPLTQPTTSHFTQIADSKVTESVTIVQSSDATVQSHRRHASDCSAIKSAFRPYSKVTTAQTNSQSNVTVDPTWNPFTAAPFGDNGKSMMDDKCFGQFFDELPRKPAHADDGGSPPSEFPDPDDSSVDMTDPFGAAPFDLPSDKEDDEDPLVDNDAQIDGTGPVMVHDESSDMDEVRVACCRRFSYEHIDGVGDDASSDSRARTEEEEEDSNTDDQRLDDDDDIDKSQTTEGAVTDEEAGNRPLLDDDELEHDYEDHDALWMELSAKKCTNPFLVPPTTRQYPNQQTPTVEEDRGIITPEAPPHNRSLATFAPIDIFQAPATLPRQVTPLFSVPRTQAKQHLPNENVPLHSPRPSAPPLPSSALVVASKYPPQAGEVAQTSQKPVIGDLSIQNEISIDPFTSPLNEHPQKSPLAPPVPQMRRETAPETVLRAELGYDGGALPPPPPHRKNTLPDGGIGQGPDSLQNHWREAAAIDPFPVPPIPPARRETLPVASPRVLRREVVPEIHADAPQKESDMLRRGSGPSPTLTAPCYSAVHAIASSSAVTSSAKSFGFNSPLMKNKKKAKEVLKRENSSTSTDSPQTDDSGTEIFYTSSSKSEKHKSKKKTKSGHKNHPSVAPLEITPRPALPVKGKKIPSAAKRGSSGTVNASFVNSSFQPEDADCSVEPL